MRHLALIAVATVAMGCPPKPPEPPPAPSDPSCVTACDRLLELGCETGMPTAEDTTCAEVCESAAGSVIEWDVTCLSVATACDSCDGK